MPSIYDYAYNYSSFAYCGAFGKISPVSVLRKLNKNDSDQR